MLVHMGEARESPGDNDVVMTVATFVDQVFCTAAVMVCWCHTDLCIECQM